MKPFIIDTLMPVIVGIAIASISVFSVLIACVILAALSSVLLLRTVASAMPPKEIARERSVPWQGVIDEYMKEEGDTLDFVIAMETWERMR